MAEDMINSYHVFVTKLQGGAFNEDLTEAMKRCVSEVADACADRGGKHKGKITVTYEFSMDAKDRVIEVNADIVEKLPKAPRGRVGLFWCDSEGNLLRQDPRQMSFDDELEKKRLRDAERAAAGQ